MYIKSFCGRGARCKHLSCRSPGKFFLQRDVRLRLVLVSRKYFVHPDRNSIAVSCLFMDSFDMPLEEEGVKRDSIYTAICPILPKEEREGGWRTVRRHLRTIISYGSAAINFNV